jgi:MAF protein
MWRRLPHLSFQSETRQSNIALWTRLPIVLASGSPRRSQILREVGFSFTTRPVNLDEDSFFFAKTGVNVAVDLAKAKARAAVEVPNRGECVVTADTVVVLDGEPLGKPASKDDALEMLRSLRARSHEVITGLSVVADDIFHCTSVSTSVRFRDYTDAEIETYIATRAPMDKAGAYGIQDKPFAPADQFSGCYLNVVGLPLCGLGELFTEARILPEVMTLGCEGHRP